MKKRIFENGIYYVLVGDYYVPELNLPSEPRSIGRWERLHREYLRVTNPCIFKDLILTGKLWTYLADLNEQAENRLSLIIQQMREQDGITEQLKEKNQMAWVRAMNNIRNRAEEILKYEMIYSTIECGM